MTCPTATDFTAKQSADRLISVVLPVYNEVAVLGELTTRLISTLDAEPHRFEIIFVDDGSTDGSAETIDTLATEDHRIRAIHFSRNFGHQAALHAGLTAANGDAIVIMDSDLQDDPAAIPRMITMWESGFQIVYAIRTQRKESPIKRVLFYTFYRILRRISRIDIPADAGNFGLIDHQAAKHIVHLPEVSRFYPGLRSWVGFSQTGIEVERAERHDNTPRVTLSGLLSLARTALFSFSSTPLTLFYAVALLSCLACFGLTTFTLIQKLSGNASPGWASGLITASFFGTLNALGIAILGEYVVRIFDQVRERPQYIIDNTINLSLSTKGDEHITSMPDNTNHYFEDSRESHPTSVAPR
jgi:dolichol-phosphate mannosyltransferase